MPYEIYSANTPTLRLESGEYSGTTPVVVDEITPELEAQRVNLRIVEIDKDGNPTNAPAVQPQAVAPQDHAKSLKEIERLQTYVSDLEGDLATVKDKAKADLAALKQKHSEEIAALKEGEKKPADKPADKPK